MRVVVVGDRKTPEAIWPAGTDHLPIAAQSELDFRLAAKLPENHYARKNLGYLFAMSRGASVVFDTDDDNAPLGSWRRRGVNVWARPIGSPGWLNAYRWFTNEHIWPRGLPLELVRTQDAELRPGEAMMVQAPIQQGLANGSPDVDAVWRLTLDKEIEFWDTDSLLLGKGVWCPFNSQSTWWFPAAYPLMYLPSFVSFRMTDIWRSLVAQRCLWEIGCGVAFHGPEVFQERNLHNLIRDFEQEIPGYLNNQRIREYLENIDLSGLAKDVGDNLLRCYRLLVSKNIVPAQELGLVEAWLHDVSRLAPTAINE